tara:strand:+ start:70 stop:288 length:219 start_codon:yes stop_codon:yes gene_type:complete
MPRKIKRKGAKRSKRATRSRAFPVEESDITWGSGNRTILEEGTTGNDADSVSSISNGETMRRRRSRREEAAD